jgi:hypothetical protein
VNQADGPMQPDAVGAARRGHGSFAVAPSPPGEAYQRTARAAEDTPRAEYRAVIYLSGARRGLLDELERRCRSYANEFSWRIVKCIRDGGDRSGLRGLVAELNDLGVQIIITGTLDMISPDQDTRDGVLAAIERSRCIVHPVTSPCRAAAGTPSGRHRG